MQSTFAKEANLDGGTLDIEMGEDDVEIGHDRIVPSISFSKKV